MLKECCEPFLNTGMTLASLKSQGTIPDANEALKMNSSGFETTFCISVKILTGMLEGPTALSDFNLQISVSISLDEVGDT